MINFLTLSLSENVWNNHDCKQGMRKKICRDCFSFGDASTAIAGDALGGGDGDGDSPGGAEAAPGYTPKFTFGKDSRKFHQWNLDKEDFSTSSLVCP